MKCLLSAIRYNRAVARDQIINYDASIPKEIVLEDKTELEQIRFIEQLQSNLGR